MKQARLIMVFGISGVGKTTACMAYAEAHSDYRYERASRILQNARGLSVEALRTEDINSIKLNQTILPPAVAAIRRENLGCTILLDSHAVIDNDLLLVEVPISIVSSLEPDAFVLLEADAYTINQRRKNSTRSRPSRDLEQISAMTKAEQQAVESYHEALKKPLVVDTVCDGYDLQSAIDKLNLYNLL